MFSLPSLYETGIMLPAIVLGLTLHELAHGLVADRLGDPTARYQGRLTLNPLAHVDIIGLIMLLGVGFGWAKPVPINPYNFRGDMRRGIILVSLAGPLANILLAIAGAVAMGLGAWKLPYGRDIVLKIIDLNVILAVFNLLPIPPLDGSKILACLLPGRQSWLYTLENYGTIILLLLLFTGIIGNVLRWIIVPLYHALLGLAKVISFIVS
ncbi:site-2 protease family protein [Desulfofundulus sp.]|uniref:site-2 protease family protein n=1 Tax=Desulfofundulus sp. TaxID=2282750 RepID=UPI003C796083